MANYYTPSYYQYPGYPMYQQPQQSYAQPAESMIWVEGEVGAKAFQKPANLPPNTPVALWDSTEKKVFLKSWSQVGMANPMTELDYEIKQPEQQKLPEGISGADMSQYATKKEFEDLHNDVKKMAEDIAKMAKNRGGQQ